MCIQTKGNSNWWCLKCSHTNTHTHAHRHTHTLNDVYCQTGCEHCYYAIWCCPAPTSAWVSQVRRQHIGASKDSFMSCFPNFCPYFFCMILPVVYFSPGYIAMVSKPNKLWRLTNSLFVKWHHQVRSCKARGTDQKRAKCNAYFDSHNKGPTTSRDSNNY